MSAEEFRAWLDLMGITATEASVRLGVSKNTITSYRQSGAEERVKLACRSLARAAGKVETVDVYTWERGS